MIAGQLTRVQIGEIAVSRWWSFPYSCLTPTDYYCSSLRRILFLSSLFRLGRDRWTGQRPPSVLHVLAGGSPLGKRWDQEEGRGWCTRDLLIGIPDSIRKTCRRDFFLMATTFLRSLSYLVTRRPIREGNRVVLFSRVLNSRRWCFPFLV